MKPIGSKGFTLVELMIVVAIIGILASVALPFYQRYIQKSRLVAHVFPGVHIIESNLSTYYSARNTFPNAALLGPFVADANTAFFTPSWGQNSLRIEIKAGPKGELISLAGTPQNFFVATPRTKAGKIVNWALSGPIAIALGLEGEGN